MRPATYIPRLVIFATLGFLWACAPIPAAPATTTAEPLPTASFTPAASSCSAVKAQPTPASSVGVTAVSSTDFVRGSAAAPVTLLAYCDFQSAECELFNRVLDELVKNHPEDLKVVMRPIAVPVTLVPALDKSELSTRAALAAGDQGKFWEMRDLLHSRYNDWAKLPAARFTGWVEAQAADLKLDIPRFKAELGDKATRDRTRALYEDAVKLGVSAIPTVFINGTLQQRPALSYDGLESTISLILLGARQFTSCPPLAIDPARVYIATLHTVKGDIVVRLFADRAPLAVNSFVFLARQGWYDGVTFHRVIPGFIAQAGDPSGTGRGGPGYYFASEIRADLTFDKPGVLGLANSGPDTNGSQFFITYAAEPQLDGAYTVFGQVTSGMDVLESLTPRDPQSSAGVPPGDKLLTVTIQEN